MTTIRLGDEGELTREDLAPGSAAWTRLVTASKVAAIFGVANPNYSSARALWHEMRGDVPRVEGDPTPEQERGHLLEPAVLEWWRRRHPEYTTFDDQHVATRDDLRWAIATPDCLASGPVAPPAVVEAKTVGRPDDEWGEPGTDQVPPRYLLQVFFQMLMTGARIAYVPRLGPFLEFEEFVVEYDEAVAAAVVERCREFYESLSGDVPPPMDGSPATFAVIRRMYDGLDRDLTVQLDPQLAHDFVAANTALKAAETERQRVVSLVREEMGAARIAKCGDVPVARRQGARGGISVVCLPKSTAALPPLTERSAAA